MNQFIIIVTEEFDCHSVSIPYPLITEWTKEEVLSALNKIADTVCTENPNEIDHSKLYGFSFNFPGTEAVIPAEDFFTYKNVDGKWQSLRCLPPILTVEEWINEPRRSSRRHPHDTIKTIENL